MSKQESFEQDKNIEKLKALRDRSTDPKIKEAIGKKIEQLKAPFNK